MYLKRLDLVGFKSFATPTALTFEPGISVLCGPNGSGKSNVADAVRWGLGEQSARAIRGRRGEDVIFVGSQDRRPLGLSEVSLTLDNAEGRIPLEYQEIKITRRLYRSGESEYLINGSRMRLKDIHDWLLHAALDPDSYVVVGQGSVDELILQRPEERRVVIENAADIRRHQARLVEARGRVAATEENLFRCRAVVAELEPHVKRLSAQAARAERYGRLRDELLGVAAGWFRYALHEARGELTASRRQVALARAESDRLDGELSALEAQAGEADQAAAAAEWELGRAEPELAAMLVEQARLATEQAVAVERSRGADEAAAALRDQVVELNRRSETLRTRVADAQRALDRARQSLFGEEEALRADEAECTAREGAAQIAEEELGRVNNAMVELDAQARAFHLAFDAAVDRGRRAAREQEKAGASAADSEAALAEALHTSEQLARDAHDRQQEAQHLRSVFQELGTRRELARSRMNALHTRQLALVGERQQAEITMQALMDPPAGEIGASADLGSVPGARGWLAAELDVPERAQTAVSAVLGESARGVVFDTPVELAKGLCLLADTAGQQTRLVARQAHFDTVERAARDFQRTARELLRGTANEGFAEQLVSCDPLLQSIRTRYLGFVVVASDLTAAAEIARRLAAPSHAAVPWQVVTLAGQVVAWDGEWRVGRDRSTERLVARRRQVGELEATVSRLSAGLTDLQARIATADREQASLADEDWRARLQMAEADRLEVEGRRAAERAATNADRLAQQIELARAAEAKAVTEWERANSEAAELEHRLGSIQTERAALSERMERANAEVAASRSAREQLRITQAERRAQMAAAISALQSQERQVARDRDELADLERAALVAADRAKAETERAKSERDHSAQLVEESAQVARRLATAEESVTELRERRRAASLRRSDVERDAAQLRTTIRGQRSVIEATALREGRAADRVERVRREAQEFAEERDAAGESAGGQLSLGLGAAQGVDGGVAGSEATPPVDPETVRRRMTALRRELRTIGPINDSTLAEFAELRDRHWFLSEQIRDLEAVLVDLRSAMMELEGSMKGAFSDAFGRVNEAFSEYFGRLFGGGHAELVLTRPDDVLEAGVDIVARPPGKRLQPLVSLSGGERALTMVALIFGLLKTNPAPFCVLDEVDAALDDSNVLRFADMLRELSERTQFLIVSHNRATMEIARALYGVSMDTRGISTVVSLRLAQEAAR